MRGSSMARMSSNVNRGINTRSSLHGENPPHPIPAHGVLLRNVATFGGRLQFEWSQTKQFSVDIKLRNGVASDSRKLWRSVRFSSLAASSGSSGSSFRNALIGGALGAAGGVLAVEAGKAMFHSNKRSISYVEGHGRKQCSMPLDEMTRHNDRLHQIVWTCGQNEVCCGKTCCPLIVAENYAYNMKILAVILGVVLVVLLAFCVIYCVYYLNNDECIDIDDPSRYVNYSYSDDLYGSGIRRKNYGPQMSPGAACTSGTYPYNGYPSQDPNYYLPGYPPPYPPAYPQCYPPQSPATKAPPEVPVVHKQQESHNDKA
ncbi:hypothetical protein Y032_0361g3470 [Ancylostoma ceylanicum]|nr:hypothetical protein Y032_0361g3470 [Ancylostoma ceylanicum]